MIVEIIKAAFTCSDMAYPVLARVFVFTMFCAGLLIVAVMTGKI